jgi:hypothetical protein
MEANREDAGHQFLQNRTMPMNTRLSLSLLVAAAVLSGCAAESIEAPLPQSARIPDTNVYFYPTQGRTLSADQQARDKYECNTWAVQQTGFDPSDPHTPPHQRMQIVAGGSPPGTAVGAGALTGAIAGAAVSRPWESGRGALLGGLAGAAIGGLVEAERNNEVNRLQGQADVSANQMQSAALEQKAASFRRAIGACLEGRGYSVK